MDLRIKVSKVENVTCWREGKKVEGSLHLTAHHIIFRYPLPPSESKPESKPRFGESWLTYPMISYCTYRPTPPASPHPPSIRLRCRDFTFVSFHFLTDAEARSVYDSVKALTCKLGRLDKLYAFSYIPHGPEKLIDGWRLYDPRKEFARQGISEKSGDKGWRFTTINSDYSYSPTYPAVLVVPSAISDSVLKYGAKYRSRCRIPALTYFHPINNCTITRSSQPMRSYKEHRNVQDERLVAAICATTKNTKLPTIGTSNSASTTDLSTKDALSDAQNDSDDSTLPVGTPPDQTSFADVDLVEDEAIRKAREYEDAIEARAEDPSERKIYGAQQNNLIVDARPRLNALAMQGLGRGSEKMDNYRCCSKVYLNIENIHVMRNSLEAVINLIKDSDISPLPLNQDQLSKTKWLNHIANMIDGVGIIARTIGIHHSHVLIHCSDGWDRTSQLSALSQLCLDPYFRTIDGFTTLVEKDWLSFGHMFRHRCGPLGSEKWFEIENERVSNTAVSENGAPIPSAGSGNNTFENALSRATGFFRGSSGVGSTNGSSESESEPFKFKAGHPTGEDLTDKKLITDAGEVSPMFQQFLDGVYQLQYQHPTRFEFNERFLRRLLYHLYSCQYGTFLFDNEFERQSSKAKTRTHSVWNYFLSRRKEFTNPTYDPEIDDHVPGKERLIFPRKEETRWWAEGFGRKDSEMNGIVPGAPQLSVQDINAPVLAGVETADFIETTPQQASSISRGTTPQPRAFTPNPTYSSHLQTETTPRLVSDTSTPTAQKVESVASTASPQPKTGSALTAGLAALGISGALNSRSSSSHSRNRSTGNAVAAGNPFGDGDPLGVTNGEGFGQMEEMK
ncbi:phosphatases II [Tothia fuscella]|uniref:Phosphatases II n=1 Tax=Tothia fuscella TaxID=1048955 RepID=A0A9P4TX16_9PEZI|nr:phosphatases II [Tothia fuscella]